MPRPPKKPKSQFSIPSPVPHGNIDRGLVRPEWKERLRARAEERAKFGRPGAQPAPPSRPLTKKEKSKLWDPFMIWAPTPEQIEEARAEAERISRFHEAIIPEAEREYVKAQAEAWRRGERTLERPGAHTPYSSRYQSQRAPQTPAAAPTPVPPPKLEVTPEYLAQVFNLDKMFDHVRDMRKDPRFKAMGNTGSVGVISPAGIDAWGKVLKTAQFFGIPEASFSRLPREEVWDKVIKPFLDEVERVLNSMKPAEIPGRFKFEGAASGIFGLLYTEK